MTIRSPPHLKVPFTVDVATTNNSRTRLKKRGSSISAITLENDEIGYFSSGIDLDDEDENILSSSPHRQDRFRSSLHDSSSSSFFSWEDRDWNTGPMIPPQRRASFLIDGSNNPKVTTMKGCKETLDSLPILPHRRAEDFMISSSLRGRGGPLPVNLKSILPPIKPLRQISTDVGP